MPKSVILNFRYYHQIIIFEALNLFLVIHSNLNANGSIVKPNPNPNPNGSIVKPNPNPNGSIVKPNPNANGSIVLTLTDFPGRLVGYRSQYRLATVFN